MNRKFEGTPQEAARLLGGECRAGYIVAPGPGHSRVDRSLSVKIDPNSEDGFVVKSHADDCWKLSKDHARAKLGLEAWKPGKRIPYDKENETGFNGAKLDWHWWVMGDTELT